MSKDNYSLGELKELQALYLKHIVSVSNYFSQPKGKSTTTNFFEAAKVEKPTDELVKLASLAHSNATKLGLVFKAPLSPQNYSAAAKQLEEYAKILNLTTSIVAQLESEKKLSIMFRKALSQRVLELFNGSAECLSVIGQLLPGDKQRQSLEDAEILAKKQNVALRSAVGKIWNTCENLKKDLQGGELSILKRELQGYVVMIEDVIKDLEEWLEDPEAADSDPFGLENFSDDEDVKKEVSVPSLDKTASDNEDDDSELAQTMALTKPFLNKAQLLHKLYTYSFTKALKEPAAGAVRNVSTKQLNALHIFQNQLIASIDDFTSSVLMNGTVPELEDGLKNVDRTVNSLTECLVAVGSALGNSKVEEVVALWKKKYFDSK